MLRNICKPASFAIVLGALQACGGGTSTPLPSGTAPPSIVIVGSQSQLPAPQTTWTYQQQVTSSTDSFYNGRTGNITATYLGMQTYRGATYYTVQYDGLEAPPPTNYFVQNSDGSFSEAAAAFYNFNALPCASPQQEDILQQPLAFGTVQSAATVAETEYQCGAVANTSQSTLSVRDGSSGVANTPGGSFQCHIVAGTFVSFGVTRQFTDYIAGNTVVERDVSYSDPAHGQSSTAVTKYVSGPLNVAFPGLSMLLAQYW